MLKIPGSGSDSEGVSWGNAPEPDVSSKKEHKKEKKISESVKDSITKPSHHQTNPRKIGKINVSNHHHQEMRELFDSSIYLKSKSKDSPLIPLFGENANDVYISNFQDEHSNVVFKPGDSAARSKICSGIVRIISSFENVIVATKTGQATVVSRKDCKVEEVSDVKQPKKAANVVKQVKKTEYAKVYNPDKDEFYLVEEKSKKNSVNIVNQRNSKEAKTKKILGKIGKKDVELTPVKGQPGFYKMAVLGKNQEEDDDQFVMRYSLSPPSRIDELVEEKAPWALVNEGDSAYIVPVEKTIKLDIKTENVVYDPLENPLPSQTKEEKHLPLPQDLKTAIVEIDGTKYSVVIKDNKDPDLSPVEFELYPLNDDSDESFSLDDSIVSDDSLEDLPVNEEKEAAPKELAKKYALCSLGEDELVLAPRSYLLNYEGDEVTCDGKVYEIELSDDDDGFVNLTPTSESSDETSFVKVKESSWNKNLITTKDGEDFVRRNEQDYHLVNNGGKINVIGENIEGMVQFKVTNIFTQAKDTMRPVSLLDPSPELESFFKRIDMPSFIQAFIATTLLRPQDGKIGDLTESNVLFQALPNEDGKIDPADPSCKLRPVIIDLDETMPPANDFTQDPEFVKPGEKTTIHAVRNGLMAFPHAARPLNPEEKTLALGYMREVLQNREGLMKFLKIYQGKKFNENHLSAFEDVLNKFDQFEKEYKDKDWSLQSLFFFVLPEYERQWNALGKMPDAEKAQHIGKVSVENVLKIEARKGVRR